jgi:hypothetical protein
MKRATMPGFTVRQTGKEKGWHGNPAFMTGPGLGGHGTSIPDGGLGLVDCDWQPRTSVRVYKKPQAEACDCP